MKRIYNFARQNSARNYTVSDLQELKVSGKKLTMANPANAEEILACKEAGIDLFTVGMDQLDNVRAIAPTIFTGTGSTWAQFGSHDEILADAFEAMRRGADLYYTLRSYEAMEMLSREGIPVQSHIGLIPTFSHYCGGLRGWGRKADEAMKIFETLKRMEDVGVIAVEAECIAEDVLEAVNKMTSIVTFSLGSGMAGDVIMSFVADICGEASEEDTPPNMPMPLVMWVDSTNRFIKNVLLPFASSSTKSPQETFRIRKPTSQCMRVKKKNFWKLSINGARYTNDSMDRCLRNNRY